MTATATDSKGTISKIEFYNGTTLLGSATASPYTYNWTNAAVGTYSITAKATDSQSITQTSNAASVQVKAAATTPPTVSLTPALKQTTQTAPANGSFIAPADISLAATATPASGSTIAKVEFYQGATLIGTATAPTTTNGNTYSVNWTNVTANSYNITAKATDNKSATATTAPVTVNVINNSAPTVSLTANPANATAPATIILNATATDSDGTIAQVEFLNGTNSIATVTQAPYTTNWANVAQGSYSLTAKATDNLGVSTTSVAVPVAVTASAPKIYDIHTDQIDTPRVITDQNGNEVWRWDSAPFGESLPNEQPTQATAKFVFNLRFAGQQYDAETGLHYNYYRDYDPQAGRYVQSDPIGLYGGSLSTYDYVNSSPLDGVDPTGLCLPCIGVVIGGAWYMSQNTNWSKPSANLPTWNWDSVRKAANWVANAGAKPGNESKPTDAPRGTRGIDEQGWDRDTVHEIKDGVNAGPKDWTGISPAGDVWTSDVDGKGINHGPPDTKSNKKPGGKGGKNGRNGNRNKRDDC
ncbi:hypothetical protein UNDKW_4450 [Undibacterium sp. KW1]|nr:hypothetical protein UNDKW_4450 [Undibacterium sp. KW1]